MPSFIRSPRKGNRFVAALALVCYSTIAFGKFRAAAFTSSNRLPRSSSVTSRAKLPASLHKFITRTRLQQQVAKRKLVPVCARQWEGDDIRWFPRLRRRYASSFRTRTPARTALRVLNIAFFSYQVTNAVNFVRLKHPAYWPREAGVIIWDVLIGTSIFGPLTMDFVHSGILSRRQPHRYLTAGFVHGSLIHLLVNMDSLRRIPLWLETGLGWPLFVTTFLVGIVSGNGWYTLSSLDNSFVLGASGGICALYGLMFTALIKMGNAQQGTRVLKSMGLLLLLGYILPNVSNASHIGGFLGGIAMGILFSPSYRKSYSLTRKNSLDVDLASREYRLAMGFGKVPSNRGLVPLYLLWILAILALASNPLYRRMPMQIYTGIVHPGSLSSVRPRLPTAMKPW